MTHSTGGRFRAMAVFLWVAITSWAIGLGAKIFDLLVVATAWGASPPASFERLPYGKDYPINPGLFFQPLSALILVGALGALISGWKTPARRLLFVAVASFAIIWALTPTIFWPMIDDLLAIHRGRISRTDLEVVALVHRWFVWDSFRTALIAVGFVASVRALCIGGRVTAQSA